VKTIKPQRLSILHRTYEHERRTTLALTVLLYVPLDRRLLLPEAAMYKALAEEVGDQALDECMPKHRAEVLVDGHAFPPGGGAKTGCPVRVAMGRVDKTLYAVGDRHWTRLSEPSAPLPFTRMPLGWANAFGGPTHPENPLGKGVTPVDKDSRDVQPLPNVEHPQRPMTSPDDRPLPAGFGAIPLQWPQRFRKVGTYDERWQKELAPGLARDIDWTFFNMAPEDQQQAQFFAADESFVLENMHPERARIEGKLPGAVARVFVVRRRPGSTEARPLDGSEDLHDVPMRIDTVRFFPHLLRAVVSFRGVVPVMEDDASDIACVVAAVEEAGVPRPVEHYRGVFRQRLDKKKAAVYALSDRGLVADALMPGAEDAKVEDPVAAHAELTRSDDLLRTRARANAALQLETMRTEMKAAGLDPEKHPLPAPPPPAGPTSIEDLPEELEAQLKSAEEERAKAIAAQEAMEKEARELCVQQGVDFDAMVKKARKEAAGPPKITAAGELERMEETAKLFRNIGKPSVETEALLRSPDLRAKLQTLEAELRLRYRQLCHHFPAAERLGGDEGALLGARFIADVGRGESVAERDFTGAHLAGAKLAGAKLGRAWLEAASLAGADLQGADLQGAVLARADLTDADLRGANLTGANLGEADLTRARLDRAVLAGAVFAKTHLAATSLVETTLTGVDFTEARFEGTDLSRASLAGATLYKVDMSGLRAVGLDLSKANVIEVSLRGADLAEAKLCSTSFVTIDATGASFQGADLSNVRFVHDSTLDGAVFAKASCCDANFRGASLAGADFADARLDRSDLSGCNLERAKLDRASAVESLFIGTNLRGASMVGVDLRSAIVQRATIEGADFRRANLFRADFARAKGDDATRFEGANMKFIRVVERGKAPPLGRPPGSPPVPPPVPD